MARTTLKYWLEVRIFNDDCSDLQSLWFENKSKKWKNTIKVFKTRKSLDLYLSNVLIKEHLGCKVTVTKIWNNGKVRYGRITRFILAEFNTRKYKRKKRYKTS